LKPLTTIRGSLSLRVGTDDEDRAEAD